MTELTGGIKQSDLNDGVNDDFNNQDPGGGPTIACPSVPKLIAQIVDIANQIVNLQPQTPKTDDSNNNKPPKTGGLTFIDILLGITPAQADPVFKSETPKTDDGKPPSKMRTGGVQTKHKREEPKFKEQTPTPADNKKKNDVPKDPFKLMGVTWQHGPVVKGKKNLADCPGWQQLEDQGKITAAEKEVIITVSGNEGKPDSIQGYDSQVLSVGFIQKTIAPNTKHPADDGTGELPLQVWEFAQSNQEKYNTFFAANGWTVVWPIQKDKKGNPVIDKKTGKPAHVGKPKLYLDPTQKLAPGETLPKEYQQPITGYALKQFFRYQQRKYGVAGWYNYIQPWQTAAADGDFQRKQIIDAVNRLRRALGKAKNGITPSSYPLSSEIKAIILDESINAPSNVGRDFNNALNTFLSNHKDFPKDPSQWTPAQQATFQSEFPGILGPHRPGMTDPVGRYKQIKNHYHPKPPKKTIAGNKKRS